MTNLRFLEEWYKLSPQNAQNLGRRAYDTYAECREWKTCDDKRIPQWLELPEEIKYAWSLAALQIFDAVIRTGRVSDENGKPLVEKPDA